MAESNIQQKKEKLEQRDDVERVTLDGDESGIIFRAMISNVREDVDNVIGDVDVDVQSVKHLGRELQAELR